MFFRISLDILLTEEYLSVELTLTNLGDDNMPFGLGLHPYFPIVGDTKIRARVHKMWRTKNHMPTALVRNAYCHQLELESGLSPARIRLDHTFTGWDGNCNDFKPKRNSHHGNGDRPAGATLHFFPQSRILLCGTGIQSRKRP